MGKGNDSGSGGSKLMESLAMGGYGAYVWTCFGLAAAVLIINEWRVRARQASVYKEIEVRIKALEESA
jgi:heme exporter protein CcmD